MAAAVGLALVLGSVPGMATAQLNPADCGRPGVTTLADVRGLNGSPVAEGTPITVEATVTASFPGRAGLNGFFIESGQPRVGLFVYAPDLTSAEAPEAGERWRLQARAGRYRGRIQLEALSDAVHCGEARLRPIQLSASALDDPGRYVDQLVHIRGPLTVTGNAALGRYGTLRLAVGGRLFQTANGTRGGRPFPLLLDDGSYRRDPRPVPHTRPHGVRRAGDEVTAITGVVTHAFGAWRIHPTRPPDFVIGNPRPRAPAAAAGLRLAHLNLENYFLDRRARGPDTVAGFRRQQRRLEETLRRIDADVLILHEVENEPAAVADLLALLNQDQPEARHYAAVLDERSAAVIRTVILYRPARLERLRAARQVAAVHPRDPVAAVFRKPGGQRLVVVGAHFKSRGGCPETGDIDRGEGCWSERRHAQSVALLDWLAEWLAPRALEQQPLLLLADLNAYAGESPLRPFRKAGLSDRIAAELPPTQRYTYVYRGRAGYLDHALANPTATAWIRRVSIWHVNADEPAYLADSGEGVWRASDHDPLIIDLRPAESSGVALASLPASRHYGAPEGRSLVDTAQPRAATVPAYLPR